MTRTRGSGLKLAEPSKIRSRSANISRELKKIDAKIFERQHLGNCLPVRFVALVRAGNGTRNVDALQRNAARVDVLW